MEIMSFSLQHALGCLSAIKIYRNNQQFTVKLFFKADKVNDAFSYRESQVVWGTAGRLDWGLQLQRLVTVEPSVRSSVSLFLISLGCNFHKGNPHFHGWKQDKWEDDEPLYMIFSDVAAVTASVALLTPLGCCGHWNFFFFLVMLMKQNWTNSKHVWNSCSRLDYYLTVKEQQDQKFLSSKITSLGTGEV